MRRRQLLAGITLATLPTAAHPQSLLGQQTQPSQPAAPTPIPPNPQRPKQDDTIGPGFTRAVITSWGDPVLPGAPPLSPSNLTPAAAAQQVPPDAITAGLIPTPAQDGIPSLIAIFANPFPPPLIYPTGQPDPATLAALQGATILNLQYQNNRWNLTAGGYQSRRITAGTLCRLSGPLAATLGDSVQGLLNPTAATITPWATALFAESGDTATLNALAPTGGDIANPQNGAKYGWLTELNPADPAAFPIKRTALGRFPRAGLATATTPDGRPVIFMSQAGPTGFLLRFIAASNATDGTALDSGQLSAAQINQNTITWRPLPPATATLAATINAAQAANASPFNAPAGLAIDATGGLLYLACRGNPARTTSDTLNPPNQGNGHIIVFTAPNADLTAETFTGNLAIVAGNPATTPLTQYTAGSAAWLRNPTTLNLDPTSQLFIGTDQSGNTITTADGLFTMQTTGPSKFLLNIAYLAPTGAAIGVAAFHAATKTTITAVRHPGATPTATYANPATRWPTLQPPQPPQTTIIGLTEN